MIEFPHFISKTPQYKSCRKFSSHISSSISNSMFMFPDLSFGTLGISIISNFQMVKSYIGSLHTPEVIEKFRKLGASQEVLLVLQQGLYMPYEDSMIPKNEFFTHNKGDSTCLSSSACHISCICQIRIGRAGDDGQVWTQRPTSKIESSPTNKLRSGS